MTAARRRAILGHVEAITRRPWRGEGVDGQRAELAAFRAALARRGEATDADVMVAFEAASAQLGRAS
jgi:hypothetical protein